MPVPDLTLPAITGEQLEVPLLTWSRDVDDPTTLDFESAVSSDHNTQRGPAPALDDAAWTPSALVDAGTAARHDYRIRVPVVGLAAGRYGVWVRVAGSASSSPARWAGVLTLR